jgi:integrase
MSEILAIRPGITIPFTFQRASSEITTWVDLTIQQRRGLQSALARAAKLIGLPLDVAILSPDALRSTFLNKSARALGLEEKSVRNIRSSLRAVMRRLDIIDERDTPLTPCWTDLLNKIPTKRSYGLVGFGRYCSGSGISPDQVTDAVFDAYREWLGRRTINKMPIKCAGEVCGEWNRALATIPGWPGSKLTKLRNRDTYILPLSAFHPAFVQDLKVFADRMGAGPLDDRWVEEDDIDLEVWARRPARPCRRSTIDNRVAHARWAASALVASGVPAFEITSLACLVTPATPGAPHPARRILKFVDERAGGKPTSSNGHIGEVLRIIARHHVGQSEIAVKAISKWAGSVSLSYIEMTADNASLIRQMLQPETRARYLTLPTVLMTVARKLKSVNPKRAAAIAMRATAINFLTFIPLRLDNLIGMQLGRHLHRSNPPNGTFTHVRFESGETKNGRTFDVPIPPTAADLLQEWIDDFRPIIAAAGNVYLFPGHGTGTNHITPQGMRDAIKETMNQHVGVPLSPHKFRHLGAIMYLRAHPGHYEDVRQMLGHADIRTTIRAYCGVEKEFAVNRFHEVMEAERRFTTPDRRRSQSQKPAASVRRSVAR